MKKTVKPTKKVDRSKVVLYRNENQNLNCSNSGSGNTNMNCGCSTCK